MGQSLRNPGYDIFVDFQFSNVLNTTAEHFITMYLKTSPDQDQEYGSNIRMKPKITFFKENYSFETGYGNVYFM